MTKRISGRSLDQLRDIECEVNFLPNAEGSCLIKCGNTHVICAATVDTFLPHFLKGKGQGWVTAEYGMLPRSTHSRIQRESTKGKQDGRTQEIQRLIGRSLRAVVDLKTLGERQIIIDCDVIKADGGTRTASITGGYIALYLAAKKLYESKAIARMPFKSQVAAISCGLVNGMPMLDLDYSEDSNAEADANFVMTKKGELIEVQATAEQAPFSEESFKALFDLAKKGISELVQIQNKALGINEQAS